jgi:hypothetical protein
MSTLTATLDRLEAAGKDVTLLRKQVAGLTVTEARLAKLREEEKSLKVELENGMRALEQAIGAQLGGYPPQQSGKRAYPPQQGVPATSRAYPPQQDAPAGDSELIAGYRKAVADLKAKGIDVSSLEEKVNALAPDFNRLDALQKKLMKGAMQGTAPSAAEDAEIKRLTPLCGQRMQGIALEMQQAQILLMQRGLSGK